MWWNLHVVNDVTPCSYQPRDCVPHLLIICCCSCSQRSTLTHSDRNWIDASLKELGKGDPEVTMTLRSPPPRSCQGVRYPWAWAFRSLRRWDEQKFDTFFFFFLKRKCASALLRVIRNLNRMKGVIISFGALRSPCETSRAACEISASDANAC